MNITQASFVYMIAVCGDGTLRAPVKVGISDQPAKRFVSLKQSCPYRLEVVAVFCLPSRSCAAQIEKQFHATAAAQRRKGEWFDMPLGQAVASLHAIVLKIAPECCEPLTSIAAAHDVAPGALAGLQSLHSDINGIAVQS